MCLWSCINTSPILILDASHSISNAFLKSSKAKIVAEHNFSFKKAKVDLCSSLYLNPTDFLIISFKGVTNVLKYFTKHL